jgi:16S rRNA (guanine527-N7)-methyltransferase
MILKEENNQYKPAREIAELKTGMIELGIPFNSDMLRRFDIYLKILYSYHGKIHLISHRDFERISRRHFLPSLTAMPYLKNHRRVCDVGSGAGFPSIPLKIVLPKLDLVLFEAQYKKALFLEHLIETLCLEKIRVVHMRAERYSGELFDLALLKAVGSIRVLVRVLDILLEPGGEAIFYKSSRAEDELKAAARSLAKMHFTAEVKNVCTPLEKLPLALVVLCKRPGELCSC